MNAPAVIPVPFSPGPIIGAGARPLSRSYPGPSVRTTVLGAFRPLALVRIQTVIRDGSSVDIKTPIRTSGMLQPLKGRKLEIKWEGQRRWASALLHTTPELILFPNDRVEFEGLTYMIVGEKNFSAYGYMRYELIQDYGTP